MVYGVSHYYQAALSRQPLLLVDNLGSVLKVSLSFIGKLFLFCNCMLYTASRVLPYSLYGDGDSPVVYSNVHCHGNEKSVFDCQLSPASSTYCASHYRHLYTLSIRCTDGEN